MNRETLDLLKTPCGLEALAEASALSPTEATLLACSTILRKKYPANLTRAVLETTLLRRRAARKFSRAEQMFFEREALEQASGEVVSHYRAERFGPFPQVADLCCGLGGDSIALAKNHFVTAVDADADRLELARHNASVYGIVQQAKFVADDVLNLPLNEVAAAFADPDRRSGRKRHVSPRYYQPTLDQLRARLPSDAALGVKLAPAVAWHDLEPLDAEIEFISVEGELKECVAWFGPLRRTRRRAALLPHRVFLEANAPAASPGIAPPKAYLYDPDPAIIRAGLVTNLGEQLGATMLDPEIAFLSSDHLGPTPFATVYRVEESQPFHAKRLAERLRELHVGRITLVKRGSAVESEAFTRLLKLKGDSHRVIILTRAEGKPWMMIGEKESS